MSDLQAQLLPDGPKAVPEHNIPQWHHEFTGEYWIDELGDEHEIQRQIDDPPIPYGVVFHSVTGFTYDSVLVVKADTSTYIHQIPAFTPNGGDVTVPLLAPL